MANESLVPLANKLLQRLDIPYRLAKAEQCDSSLFIETFSKIAPRIGGEWPEDVSSSKATARSSHKESQSRIQLILDSLLAMLSTDLSHISAKAVVDGDLIAGTYLLEIFLWVLDYLDEVSRKLAVAARSQSVQQQGGLGGIRLSSTVDTTPTLSCSSLSSDSSGSLTLADRSAERAHRRSARRKKAAQVSTASAANAVTQQPLMFSLPNGGGSSSSLCSVSDLLDADISSAESHDGRHGSDPRGPHAIAPADISISSIASDSSKASIRAGYGVPGGGSGAAASQGDLSSSRRRSKRRQAQWDGDVVAGAPTSRHDKSSASSELLQKTPARTEAPIVEPVSSTPKKPSVSRRVDRSQSSTTGSSHLSSGAAQPATSQPSCSLSSESSLARHPVALFAAADSNPPRSVPSFVTATSAYQSVIGTAATALRSHPLVGNRAGLPVSSSTSSQPLTTTTPHHDGGMSSASRQAVVHHVVTAPQADVQYPHTAVSTARYVSVDRHLASGSGSGSTSELLRDVPHDDRLGSTSLSTNELLNAQYGHVQPVALGSASDRYAVPSSSSAGGVGLSAGAAAGQRPASGHVMLAPSQAMHRHAVHSSVVDAGTLQPTVISLPPSTAMGMTSAYPAGQGQGRSGDSYPAPASGATVSQSVTSAVHPIPTAISTTSAAYPHAARTVFTASTNAAHPANTAKSHDVSSSQQSQSLLTYTHGSHQQPISAPADSVQPRVTDSAPSDECVRRHSARTVPSAEPVSRAQQRSGKTSSAAQGATTERSGSAAAPAHRAASAAQLDGVRSGRSKPHSDPNSSRRAQSPSPGTRHSDDVLMRSPRKPSLSARGVRAHRGHSSEHNPSDSGLSSRPHYHHQQQQQQQLLPSSPDSRTKPSEAASRISALDTGYRSELSRFRRRTRSMTAASVPLLSGNNRRGDVTAGTSKKKPSSHQQQQQPVEYDIHGRRIVKKSARPHTTSSSTTSRKPIPSGAKSTTHSRTHSAKSPRTHRRTTSSSTASSSKRHSKSHATVPTDHTEEEEEEVVSDENAAPVDLSAGLMSVMADRFPAIQVSTPTARRMLEQHNRQMKSIVNQRLQEKQGPDQPAKMIAEAEKRQEQVVKLLKKEIAHKQRLQDQRAAAARQREVSARLRERRHASARAHRYYSDFELKLRAKLAKQRNSEEQIFRKLFEDGLAMQRSRIRDLRSYANEKGKQYASKLQDDIDSMENYYRDQFAMLAEVMEKERQVETVRHTEQTRAAERLKRELRQKMEDDIELLQEALDHGEEQDAAYVRQLEADRLRHDMERLPGAMPL